jgi:hypothetical protein
MKYAVEMDLGAVIYIPSLMNTGSGIQKLIRADTDTQTERRSHKPTLEKYATKKRKGEQ